MSSTGVSFHANQEIRSFLEELFWQFHENPELSGEEFSTTAKIREVLEGLGTEILPSDLATGLLAIIRGTGGDSESESHSVPRRILTLRADIDALALTEHSGARRPSSQPGVHHACGHDFHVAALLGAAALLGHHAHRLHGDVLLVFQPAEETFAGAKSVIDTGILQKYRARAIVGLHVNAQIPHGHIGIRSGSISAAVDRFAIHVTGEGAHGAAPHLGTDINVAISQLVLALQTIVSRTLDPFSPAVVSVTSIRSGDTWNVLPDHGTIEGTIRSFSQADRTHIQQRFHEIVAGIAQASGATFTVGWEEGPASVVNDEELSILVADSAHSLGIPTVVPDIRAGGEDFAYYLDEFPGAYFFVGMAPSPPTHTQHFVADPSLLPHIADLYREITERFLS